MSAAVESATAASAARSVWQISPDLPTHTLNALSREVRQPAWLVRVLWHRGFVTADKIRQFLSPDPAQLHDPLLMSGMATAVERILRAVERREPILIYGDYDVDGTLATVLLKTAIDRLTPKEIPSLVRYHIPHRIREGYGVQASVLGAAAAGGVKLVVSVDTGIRAFAEADEARALGLDLVVTDHHLPEGCGIPDAVAVVNPNQAGCAYPFKDLCGAAVAFKLAEATLAAAASEPREGIASVDPVRLRERLLPSLMKLVAIATVADAVPLRGENRALVWMGLRELQRVHQPGLRALMRLAEAGGSGRSPTATELGYRIGPRINAAGRMDVASDVVRLLLTRDLAEGEALAAKLHQLNEERRAVEKQVLEAIEPTLPSAREGEARCIVIDGDGWHRGVIGILASRVVERTGCPALVISHDSGNAHGSGRSIEGFHLLDAITAAHLMDADLFDRFGGHAHAVGFALPSEKVPTLRSRLAEYSQSRITPKMLERRITVDAEIPLSDIDAAMLQDLKTLEPYGHANPEPIFLACGLRVMEMRLLKERHLKITFSQNDAYAASCLCWSRAVPWPERLNELGIQVGSLTDVLFHVRENTHPQFGGPELQLCDMRLSSSPV